MSDVCRYCGHGWSYHVPWCTTCGCRWVIPPIEPEPPAPPKPPPTKRELLVAKVRDAMFNELDRQHDAGEIDGAGYWSREWGCCDGEPQWGLVAEAAIRAVQAQEKP